MKPEIFQPIGIIHSCFKEKFGTPRQSGLIPEAKAILKLFEGWSSLSNQNIEDSIRSLEGFSHLWLLFVFHANEIDSATQRPLWNPLVRPPRLGGAKKVGVFASRSPHRPNPIGLSVVGLEKIEHHPKSGILLHLSGIDFTDGTPVLDIKPYLPYADSIPHAKAGWFENSIDKDFQKQTLQAPLNLLWSEDAKSQCTFEEQLLIEKVILQDPRPAFQTQTKSSRSESEAIYSNYSMKLGRWDVHWRVDQQSYYIFRLELLSDQ